MRKAVAVILSGLLILGLVAISTARELRIAYVDSDRILEANEDYKQARQTLQQEEKQYYDQATVMEQGVRAMAEELRAQSLMLSEEARAERETRYLQKQQDLDKFRREIWGESGKLFSRNLELSKPILDKINAAIEQVSKEYDYDFVFDAASANIVYALPDHDITDKVINELKKE